MAITDRKNGSNTQILLDDKFIFANSSEYRKCLLRVLEEKPQSLDIDLSGVSFMDSAGLGMLIVTLDECKGHGIVMRLLHPRDEVQTLLRLTKSYNRFVIVD